MFLKAKSDDPNSSSQSIVEMSWSSSAADIPVAKQPPINPPMLVPAATSMGMRCSSNQRMTPMCAIPFALPPPKATPIFLRSCADAETATERTSAAASAEVKKRRAMEVPLPDHATCAALREHAGRARYAVDWPRAGPAR